MGRSRYEITRHDVFDLRDKLGLETAPEMNVLAILLSISAIMMVGVAVVIFWLFLRS